MVRRAKVDTPTSIINEQLEGNAWDTRLDLSWRLAAAARGLCVPRCARVCGLACAPKRLATTDRGGSSWQERRLHVGFCRATLRHPGMEHSLSRFGSSVRRVESSARSRAARA